MNAYADLRCLDDSPKPPPAEDPTARRVRREYERSVLAQRPAGSVPEHVDHVEDTEVAGVPIRVYQPVPRATGVAVWVHGGGWTFGSLETADATCRRLANLTGRTTWSVDYRLAPEHPYPAGLDDVTTALEAAHRTGQQVLAAGDSAGGNLIAGAVLRLRDRGVGLPLVQALAYPALDASLSTRSARREGALVERYLGPYLQGGVSRRHPYVSPLLEPDLRCLPVTVVATVEHDPLRDEGQQYATRLRDAGVVVIAQHHPRLAHGFLDSADRHEAHRLAREAFLQAAARLFTDVSAGRRHSRSG